MSILTLVFKSLLSVRLVSHIFYPLQFNISFFFLLGLGGRWGKTHLCLQNLLFQLLLSFLDDELNRSVYTD